MKPRPTSSSAPRSGHADGDRLTSGSRSREVEPAVRQRKPAALGDLVAQVFALRGCGRVQSASELDAAWGEAVGESFAKQTRPGAPRKGVLMVIVANSTLLQELTFQERRIVEHLRARLPEQKIEKLKYRIGTIE